MSHEHTTPVIVSACRTAIGRYLGGLSPLPAPQPNFRLESGDTLVVVGTAEGIGKLIQILRSG